MKTGYRKHSHLLLIAPHHGRKSGGNDDYLDILKPKITVFGNAKSKNLNYQPWLNRGLSKITNNQAGNIVLDIYDGKIDIFVENKLFAEKCVSRLTYNNLGYYICTL